MANGIEVRQCLTLLAPPRVLYDFWRRLSDFPRFMRHVESVEELDERHSHWIVRGPGDRRIEWDAEIVDDIPGRLIRWRTVGNPDVRHGGRVEFRPASGGRGTVAEVHLAYEPPGGGAGTAYMKMLGDDPKQQIREDLRRFKMLVETGELSTIVGQTSARDEDDREDVGEGPGVGATERETEDYRDDVRGTGARGEKGDGMVMETSVYEVRSMEEEAEKRERVGEPDRDEDEVRS